MSRSNVSGINDLGICAFEVTILEVAAYELILSSSGLVADVFRGTD